MKLILDKMIVTEKELAFDSEGLQMEDGWEVSIPKGFRDDEAIKLLLDNQVTKVDLTFADSTSSNRKEAVFELLKSSDIEYLNL